jgi:hypothetical protein
MTDEIRGGADSPEIRGSQIGRGDRGLNPLPDTILSKMIALASATGVDMTPSPGHLPLLTALMAATEA